MLASLPVCPLHWPHRVCTQSVGRTKSEFLSQILATTLCPRCHLQSPHCVANHSLPSHTGRHLRSTCLTRPTPWSGASTRTPRRTPCCTTPCSMPAKSECNSATVPCSRIDAPLAFLAQCIHAPRNCSPTHVAAQRPPSYKLMASCANRPCGDTLIRGMLMSCRLTNQMALRPPCPRLNTPPITRSHSLHLRSLTSFSSPPCACSGQDKRLPPGTGSFDCLHDTVCYATVAGWALGGQPFTLPDQAGLPIGPGYYTKFVLQVRHGVGSMLVNVCLCHSLPCAL